MNKDFFKLDEADLKKLFQEVHNKKFFVYKELQLKLFDGKDINFFFF